MVECVAFSAAGDRIASASLDGVVGISDPSGLQPPRVFSLAESGLEPQFGVGSTSPMALGVVFTGDASAVLVAAQGRSGEVRKWSTSGEPQGHVWEPGTLYAVGLSSDGRCVVAVSPGVAPEQLLIFVAREKDNIVPVRNREELALVFGVSSSSDGKTVVVGWSDGKVQLFRTVDPPSKLVEVVHGDSVGEVSCSPDGRLFASAGLEGQVKVWDSESGELISHIATSPVGVGAIAFHPSGKHLAVGGTDGTVRIWNVASGKCEHVLEGHEGPVTAMSFSQAGDMLGIGTQDGSVRLWRLPSTSVLPGHGGS